METQEDIMAPQYKIILQQYKSNLLAIYNG